MWGRCWILTVVLVLCWASSCGRDVAEEAPAPAAAPEGPKVLIVPQETEFKNAVASALAAALEGQGCSVTLVDVSELAAQEADALNAVVLLDRVHRGRISEEAQAFLAGLPDKGKVALLATADSTDVDLGLPDVDAVTAASEMTAVDQTVQALLAKVRDRLGRP